jgi:acetyl-CoA carboxylase carboxyltransferase component
MASEGLRDAARGLRRVVGRGDRRRDHRASRARRGERDGCGERVVVRPPWACARCEERPRDRQARRRRGEDRRQHAADKLTARERIALLVDAGTFTELGLHAGIHHSVRGLEAATRRRRRDHRLRQGRRAAGRVCAYDFTVMAGSMGMTGELKVTRLRELALTKRMPFVWLLDSRARASRRRSARCSPARATCSARRSSRAASIPQVAALMGPCAAGTAYIPGLADFVPMVKGRGSMALAGPHLVRAAIGEDVTQEELGGSRVHCRKSGVGDLEVADDEECIAAIKRVPVVLPVAQRASRRRRRERRPVDRATRSCSTCCPSPTASPTTCTR